MRNPFHRQPAQAQSGDAGQATRRDDIQQGEGASEIIRAARERGTPVISMSSADMVMLGPALKARLGVRSAEDLIAAGQFADAAAMCADEIASCRKAVEAFESQGRSLSPQTAQAFDARITTALQLMGYAEVSTRDFKRALSHTAEALQIARRLADGDSAHIMHLVNGLTAFATIRLAARADLAQAGDATAEAIAILYELDGQPPGNYQQKLALVRDIGAEILNILARPQSTG